MVSLNDSAAVPGPDAPVFEIATVPMLDPPLNTETSLIESRLGSAANWPTGIDTDPPTDVGRLKYVLLQIGATLGVAALAPPAEVSTAAVAT